MCRLGSSAGLGISACLGLADPEVAALDERTETISQHGFVDSPRALMRIGLRRPSAWRPSGSLRSHVGVVGHSIFGPAEEAVANPPRAMAVTATITITTLIFFFIARARWRTPLWLLLPGAVVLLSVDGLFLAANLTKFTHGAWLPLLIGLTAFTVMTTWQRGREIVTTNRTRREGSLREFVAALREATIVADRVAGTAVFLNRGKQTAPLALRANVETNHVRHEHVVIMSVETQLTPRVPAGDRIEVDDLGFADDGITHITARYGYTETPDVPAALRLLRPEQTEGEIDPDAATYFLSKIELRAGDQPTLARWRKRLFIATSHITADAADEFGLPKDRTLIIGSHIDV